MLLALLLQAAAPSADVVVRAPLPAPLQTPATILVEPVAMLIATFDGEPDGGTDGERDGLVERSEIDAGIARTFAAIDTAKTGKLRYLAYSDWALRWLGDRAALPSPYEVDRDNDDAVSLVEMQDHFSRLFARYDKDGDKRISRAELLTFRAAPIDKDGPTGGKRPGGKPPRR
ncbi:EF-hand domain-containing protein [Sphingomonas sp.]|uniref:EF-hand domain-containing protein n=1 Tax=Sphingomonas sp. TaxID=28214 RepID=UPI0035BC01D7